MDRVVVLKTRGCVETDKPLSKTSVVARFRQWLGSGAGKGPSVCRGRAENERVCENGQATVENEYTCSFSVVVG